ncbi:fusion protein [Achimota virus 2]|uniref:Fusion glycoprotein F0 n=1 Tax=Achimota virus 2 TaxID=1261101 RepID=K7XN73_9MONO|nr:fusion protein [Achimota virus 2]AFX75116.1 fusion protein [Achimota virus 2]
MLNSFYQIICLAVCLTTYTVISIDQHNLLKAGVIVKSIKGLNFYSRGQANYIIVKLIPNVNVTDTDCDIGSIKRYNETVYSLIKPLADNIDYLRTQFAPTKRKKRFAGVAIGLTALGVATAAQVTAAVALVKAQENARKLDALADSIQATNEAVQDLSTGLQAGAIAIQAIQSEINHVINPALERLSCEIIDTRVASILNLYLIRLTTVFHRQLVNPALTPLSIQALNHLLQGETEGLVKNESKMTDSKIDLLMSGLITGQVVGVNIKHMQLMIAVFVPTTAQLPNAYVINLLTITANINNSEVLVQLPNQILERSGIIYQFRGKDCVSSPNHMYCPYSDASILSPELQLCLQGRLEMCLFTQVVGSFPTRFASDKGIVYANCRHLQCACSEPEGIIYQDDTSAITQIDASKCSTLKLDMLTFKLSTYANKTFDASFSVGKDQMLVTNLLDLSAELKTMNASVAHANKLIDKSNLLIQSNALIGHSNTIFIVVIVILAVMVLYLIIVTYIIKVIMVEVSRLKRMNIYSIDK